MALQMVYMAADGTEHPESYWRVVHVAMSILERKAQVVLFGYKDRTASTERKQPVGTRNYNVDAEKYLEYFSVTHLDTENPIATAYEVTKERGGDQKGDSFFATAVDA